MRHSQEALNQQILQPYYDERDVPRESPHCLGGKRNLLTNNPFACGRRMLGGHNMPSENGAISQSCGTGATLTICHG